MEQNKYPMEYTMEQIFADRQTCISNQMDSAINLAEVLAAEDALITPEDRELIAMIDEYLDRRSK